MKILTVDDDQFALDILVAALKGADYQDVITASSADRALEKLMFEQEPFDCILLDIRMPKIDGIELCRMIRSMPSYGSTPIIMISALTDQHNIDKAMAAGATDYVTKPFKGLELGARLRAASLLADTLQKRAKENLELHALQLEMSFLTKHDLETAIPLEPNPGVVTDLELENGLLKLPEGTFDLEIMAFAIANIQEIYDTITVADFQKFLSAVAGKILSAVDSSTSNVAYFGKGAFAIVVQSPRSGCTITEAGILSALKSKNYLGPRTEVQPVIVSARAKHPDYWSAQRAYGCLLDALKDAQSKCVDHLGQSKLSEYRKEICHETGAAPSKLWFLNSIAARKKDTKIRPKRVATRQKTRLVQRLS
tara:strand:+ start:355 stop:1452 length:1098 start_codon:yes stop_codon:yes gene_type:complete